MAVCHKGLIDALFYVYTSKFPKEEMTWTKTDLSSVSGSVFLIQTRSNIPMDRQLPYGD